MFGYRSTLTVRTTIGLSVCLCIALISALLLFHFLVVSPLEKRAASDRAALLVLASQTWLELPPDRRPQYELELSLRHGLVVSEVSVEYPPLNHRRGYFGHLSKELEMRLDRPANLRDGNETVWVDMPIPGPFQLQIGFSSSSPYQGEVIFSFTILGLATLLVVVMSFFLMRRVVLPLDKVAQAASEFRGMQETTPVPEEGPEELVSLARNFNEMAKEVSQLLANRTTLLAGVSHDLRTPLTRMFLELNEYKDQLPSELNEGTQKNLESMRDLLDNVMFYVQGETEDKVDIDLVEFTETIVEGFTEDIPIAVEGHGDGTVQIPPNAMERVLTNLISNAIQYGRAPQVRIYRSDDAVKFEVRDEGKGIPNSEKEKVLQPFYRMEQSRNESSGGSGLGLAIVQHFCEIYDWDLSLEDNPGGGVRVVVSVPR